MPTYPGAGCPFDFLSALQRLLLQLTGGGGVYNINNGIVAQDTITFDKATPWSQPRAATKAEPPSLWRRHTLPRASQPCLGVLRPTSNARPQALQTAWTSQVAVPLRMPPAAFLRANNGIEAGWTFNVGGPASAMAVPEQAFKAGLISRKVASVADCLLTDSCSC